MSQESGKITLFRNGAGWFARFSGEAEETVRYAFGTNTIPTAFTDQAPAAKVAREIRTMWPKCYVTVEEER